MNMGKRVELLENQMVPSVANNCHVIYLADEETKDQASDRYCKDKGIGKSELDKNPWPIIFVIHE